MGPFTGGATSAITGGCTPIASGSSQPTCPLACPRRRVVCVAESVDGGTSVFSRCRAELSVALGSAPCHAAFGISCSGGRRTEAASPRRSGLDLSPCGVTCKDSPSPRATSASRTTMGSPSFGYACAAPIS